MSTNTKKHKDNPRSRGWCFTYNNPKEEDYFSSIDCSFLIIGLEHCPTTGTIHHQGYLYLKDQKTFSCVQKLLPAGIHIEKAAGNAQQNITYCSKEKVLFQKGTPPNQGKRSDIDLARSILKQGGNMKQVMDEVNSYQGAKFAEMYLKINPPERKDPPEVYWYWGATGTGKTKTAFEETPGRWMSMTSLQWWEGYCGQENVLIDDFRAHFCTFSALLRFIDRYPVMVPTKGSSYPLLAKKIIITCPYHPSTVYKDRTDEDIKQLTRRLTLIIHFDTLQ